MKRPIIRTHICPHKPYVSNDVLDILERIFTSTKCSVNEFMEVVCLVIDSGMLDRQKLPLSLQKKTGKKFSCIYGSEKELLHSLKVDYKEGNQPHTRHIRNKGRDYFIVIPRYESCSRARQLLAQGYIQG